MRGINLRKQSRNWLIVFGVLSVVGTWILFLLIQTEFQKQEPLMWLTIPAYLGIACCWILTFEFPLFSGMRLLDDYLVLNRSTLVPFRRYIRIDTIEQIKWKISHLESQKRGYPTSFLPVELIEFTIITSSGKRYKSTRVPVDLDSFEKKQFFSRLWYQKSIKKFNRPTGKNSYVRLAFLPLAARCFVLLLMLLLYYPWYTCSWFPW